MLIRTSISGKSSTSVSKGQKKVCWTYDALLPLAYGMSQHHSKAACGRFTSNCQTSIRTKVLALASSTAYSTQTSTRCEIKLPPRNEYISYVLSSGSVCLDVINQTWSPMFDMINIFEVFLPQLLRYPNPTDPLNGEAAALLMRDPKTYDIKVKGSLTLSVRDCRRQKSSS